RQGTQDSAQAERGRRAEQAQKVDKSPHAVGAGEPASRPAPRATLKLGAPEDREVAPEPTSRSAPPRRQGPPADEIDDDLSGRSWLR
ncbi:MAG TPA: hypothetical protein VEG38_13775, partial [Acidimicrobiia bacterium]|nr:hypothetical protein [Acidimicrobiia bacterium]